MQMKKYAFQYVLLAAKYIPVVIIVFYILTVAKVRLDIRRGERQRRELGVAQEAPHYAMAELRLVIQVSLTVAYFPCMFRASSSTSL